MLPLDILAGFLLVRIVEGAWLPFWRRASKCNGREELCERRYSNVTVVGAHNSFAWSDISIMPCGQYLAIKKSTSRNSWTCVYVFSKLSPISTFLENSGSVILTVYTSSRTSLPKTPYLTHLQFLSDGGKVDFPRTVKALLDRNTQEVVTLIFTNPEGISIPDVWLPTFEVSGGSLLHFTWLNRSHKRVCEMIDTRKRLVVFMDSKANASVVPWILPQPQMIWEDPFTVTNASFPCSVSRVHGPLPAEDHTYLINHSLHKKAFSPIIDDVYIPDRGNLSTTNSLASIVDHSYRCSPLGAGRNPQFLLMDFIHVGDAFKAADFLNGIPGVASFVRFWGNAHRWFLSSGPFRT
ncbi:hypothetical protein FA13DRAFT_1795831 [Coprinellus micaceus]|uniref:PLC-like phosphodiesterase n=1 Tax=Coprinellus micaceus TaxID=71717 RepID=A0A4Y7SWE4_COPMI|nr:hypothetical protein FA13DRAFT_1795831 [Coprinellus micaceus]